MQLIQVSYNFYLASQPASFCVLKVWKMEQFILQMLQNMRMKVRRVSRDEGASDIAPVASIG
jgi:hypothetical protein